MAPDEPPPPILGSWGRLYGLVLVVLAALVAALTLLARHYQ